MFQTAVEAGSEEVPRRATGRDVAEHPGIYVGSVSEYRQKAEARAFGSLLG